MRLFFLIILFQYSFLIQAQTSGTIKIRKVNCDCQIGELIHPNTINANISTGTLMGKIYKQSDETIIDGAKIYLSDGSNSSFLIISNSGNYKLSNLPANKYDICVCAPGYKSISIHGVVINENKITFMDIALEPIEGLSKTRGNRKKKD